MYLSSVALLYGYSYIILNSLLAPYLQLFEINYMVN